MHLLPSLRHVPALARRGDAAAGAPPRDARSLSLLRIRERGFPRGEVLELLRDGIRFETRINVDAADRETRAKRIAGGTSDGAEGVAPEDDRVR